MTLNRANFLGSGLTLRAVCRKANLCEPYVLQIVSRGTNADFTAQQLAHICRVPKDIFLYGINGNGATRNGAKEARLGVLKTSSTLRLTPNTSKRKNAVAATTRFAISPRSVRRPRLVSTQSFEKDEA